MLKRNAVSDGITVATFNEKNRTVTDDHLTQIFSAVGRRHGYKDVMAEFVAFKDMKVRWQRTLDWISFEISDYLDRAPDDVLEDLAETLYSRIEGDEKDYNEAFIGYITSEAVQKPNQQDFFSRSTNLGASSIGSYHDLNDCVDRLRSQRLIPPDLGCELRWDSTPTSKVAGCSVLQRVVWVNSILDQKGIPENVLDYSVYNMLCHLIIGFTGHPPDENVHRKLLAKYPMELEAEEWLYRHGLYI